jgi:hypothetical protein
MGEGWSQTTGGVVGGEELRSLGSHGHDRVGESRVLGKSPGGHTRDELCGTSATLEESCVNTQGSHAS